MLILSSLPDTTLLHSSFDRALGHSKKVRNSLYFQARECVVFNCASRQIKRSTTTSRVYRLCGLTLQPHLLYHLAEDREHIVVYVCVSQGGYCSHNLAE